MTAPDPLTAQAALVPDTLAVLDPEGERLAFAELEARANRLAHGLAGLGLAGGDPVIWCGPNSVEVLVTLHAARKAGLVAVPLAYRFTADEMRYVIADSGAAVVLVDAEQAERVAAVRAELPAVREVVVFGSPEWRRVARRTRHDRRRPPDGTGGSMIYTSGTTGKPKGAVRGPTDPEYTRTLAATLRLRLHEEVHLTTGPLYHSGPLAWALLTHALGGTVVLLRRFDAAPLGRAGPRAPRHQHVHRAHAAQADRGAARRRPRAGRPVVDALARRQRRAGALRAEAGGDRAVRRRLPLRGLRLHRAGRRRGAPARGPAAQAGLVREGATAASSCGWSTTRAPSCPPGSRACCRSAPATTFAGYHGRERLADGWKSVGDIAHLDADGYVYIRDRPGDLVITGGMNVYPAEVEAVLHEHPDVLDAAVFGLPSTEWGETVHAVVVPRDGHALDHPGAGGARRGAARRLQAAPLLAGARRAAAHRVGQAPQTPPACRTRRSQVKEFPGQSLVYGPSPWR